MTSSRIPLALALLGLAALLAGAALAEPAATPSAALESARPNVLILSIDTLRADRVSAYGYERETTPNLDPLIRGGVRFTAARTVEPLTSPALCSMLTSRHPHEHGSTRNGLRLREGLESLPRALHAAGYRTAAFVGNWTLRDKLSGLGEHFEEYDEVLTRKRWFGILRGEADASDITERTVDWLERHAREDDRPFFLWAHYVEPHAPYKLHERFVDRLGLADRRRLDDSDRYDTEIAFVDHSIGRVLETLDRLGMSDDTIVVFTSDHGESLGEHGYWGHGRNLHEPGLRIPLSITWAGKVRARTIDAPALNTDIAPTLLSLVGVATPPTFRGHDWTRVLDGAAPPYDRITRYEAHKGAVISRHESDLARRAGLLEVGVIRDGHKEIFDVRRDRRSLYDLERDPGELSDLVGADSSPTGDLAGWMRTVFAGLVSFDDVRPAPLDAESIEALRSLGYVE